MIAGALIGLFILTSMAPSERIDFAQAGLGIGTVERFGNDGNHQFHCSTLDDGDPCIESALAHKELVNVLVFGASQLHAINDAMPGDQTVIARLNEELRELGSFVTSFSQPNANFKEHYILFEHLRQKIDVDILVIGAVFDDMRESGMRDSIAAAIHVAGTR